MGWNDFSKFFNLLAFILILSVSSSLAQSGFAKKSGEGNNTPPPSYILKGNFRPTVYYSYVLSDTTIVMRLYADSSSRNFTRIVKYFLTINQPDSPEKGFSKVDVNVDSIHYEFTEGDKTYKFTSLDNFDPKIFYFDDFKTISIPMSKEFTLVYSPYGEVAKIEGERLDYFRDYIKNTLKESSDSILIYNWTDGLSDERLKSLGDVFKLIYPSNQVYQDSLWKSPFFIQLEGLNIIDTVDVKLVGFESKNYVLEGNFRTPTLLPKKVKFYGLNNLTWNIQINYAEGHFVQKLTPAGAVRDFIINFDFSIVVGTTQKTFEQTTQKRIHWELVKQY